MALIQRNSATFFFILNALSVTELVDAQTEVAPLNAAVDVGNRIIFNCTSNSTPGWRYSQTGIGTFTPISPVGSCSSLDTSRFVVESIGNGSCNLIVLNATASDALVYSCFDSNSSDSSAVLTVIESVEVSPNINTAKPVAGDQLNITCSVKYAAVSSPAPEIFPEILWTNVSSNTNINGSTPLPIVPNVTTSYLNVIAIPPTVPSYACNVYFNAPNISSTPNFASNAPEYYETTNTTELCVQRASICVNLANFDIPDWLCILLSVIILLIGANLLLLLFVFLPSYGCSKTCNRRTNNKFHWIEEALSCINEKGCKCSWQLVLFIFCSVFFGLIFFPIVLIASVCCCHRNQKRSQDETNDGYVNSSELNDSSKKYEAFQSRNLTPDQLYQELSSDTGPQYINARVS